MTKINLITQGQQLINASKVVVAAGDVNSVELHVDFDSAWDAYTARSAIFYTSKDSTVYEMLLTENKCVVPHEVLAEACVLFIGVRGITTDGEGVKTSSLVKYKITEGASTAGEMTLTPTMDLYRQYLAATKERMDAASLEIIRQMKEAITAVKGEMESTILWTNPDFESGTIAQGTTFDARTIALDLSEYKTFRLVFTSITSQYSAVNIFNEITISAKDIFYRMVNDCGDYIGYRQAKISVNGITFDSGNTTNNLGGASATIPYFCIPCQLIGYKY